MRSRLSIFVLLPCLGLSSAVVAQDAAMPRDYPLRVFGVFVLPVPNAPFSARVDVVSREKLDNGSTRIRRTSAEIARDSAGRVYNEHREIVPSTFEGQPAFVSAQIYDPTTRTSTRLEADTHLAKVTVEKEASGVPAPSQAGRPEVTAKPDVKVENLGKQEMDGLTVYGVRKSRVVPAQASGTGAEVTITDEDWFSPELSMKMVTKHNDPRTGEQVVGLNDVQRAEPPASRFAVPAGYTVVNQTPAD